MVSTFNEEAEFIREGHINKYLNVDITPEEVAKIVADMEEATNDQT